MKKIYVLIMMVVLLCSCQENAVIDDVASLVGELKVSTDFSTVNERAVLSMDDNVKAVYLNNGEVNSAPSLVDTISLWISDSDHLERTFSFVKKNGTFVAYGDHSGIFDGNEIVLPNIRMGETKFMVYAKSLIHSDNVILSNVNSSAFKSEQEISDFLKSSVLTNEKSNLIYSTKIETFVLPTDVPSFSMKPANDKYAVNIKKTNNVDVELCLMKDDVQIVSFKSVENDRLFSFQTEEFIESFKDSEKSKYSLKVVVRDFYDKSIIRGNASIKFPEIKGGIIYLKSLEISSSKISVRTGGFSWGSYEVIDWFPEDGDITMDGDIIVN